MGGTRQISMRSVDSMQTGGALAQRREVGGVCLTARCRLRTFKHQRAQAQPILVAPDQLAVVLTGRAVAADRDLLVDEVA